MINKILLAIVILFLITLLGWCSPQCSKQSATITTQAQDSLEAPVKTALPEPINNMKDVPATTAPAAEQAVSTPITAVVEVDDSPTEEAKSASQPVSDAPVEKPTAMGVATDTSAASPEQTIDLTAQDGGQTKVILEGVNFKSNSDELTNNSIVALEKVISSLKQKEDIQVEIAGYSDNTGNAAYNIYLSQRRAESVVNYIKNSGIKSSRLTAKGHGAASPVADNQTAAGRLKNRRVELHVK